MSALGLNGDRHGTCVACYGATDTALAFQGEPAWTIAGLTVLGLPEAEAERTVLKQYGDSFGRLPDPLKATIRVCAGCVDAAKPNFPAPVLAIPGAEIPCVTQMVGDSGE